MGDRDDILDVAPTRREGVFERGSNVVDYWLAHCEGFTLGKASSARRVTGVVCDRHTGHAHTLYVESIRRRPRTVPARSVAAVDPFKRVLYLERHAPVLRRARENATLRARVSPYAQSAARAGLAGARSSGALAVAGCRIGGRYGKNGVLWARPRLQAQARRTALGARTHYAQTAVFARRRYAEIALWLTPHLAAGLRAVLVNADALLVALRRRSGRSS
jgi:hypothetical protein